MDKNKSTKDDDIRDVLKTILTDELRRFQKETGHPARLISELGIEHGNFRIDIVTINGIIHGYEIKSDADSLTRLPEQAGAYSAIFDKVTLVVGEKHIIRALSIIPDWWGVKLARSRSDGFVSLSNIRSPLKNTSIDKLAVSRLLWRNEALDILDSRNAVFGVKTKRRELIYQRLASVIDLIDLQEAVREKLFTRQDWRVDQLLLQCGD